MRETETEREQGKRAETACKPFNIGQIVNKRETETERNRDK